MRCWNLLLVGGISFAAALVACAPKQPEGPGIESAAGEPRYAAAFPDLVTADVNQLDAIDTQVAEATEKFSGYKEELEDPPWPRVETVYSLADSAGRSRAYVERHDETVAVMRFVVEESDELKRKVGGAAVYTGKQQGCSDPGTLGGTVNRVFEKTVDELLEERLHESNVAQSAIDRYEPELGETNMGPLRDQVDAITATSFAVHVDAVRVKLELERRIDEAKDIEETLDEVAEEYEDLAQDDERTDEQREELKDLAKAAREARSNLEGSVEQAEAALENIDERIEVLQKRYEEAFEALLESVQAEQ